MKIPSTGPVWGVVVGVPLFFICCVGVLASAVHWRWLEAHCKAWFDEIHGGQK